MNDAELTALALYVNAQALGRRSEDEQRIANGCSVAYGDLPIQGENELMLELVRRGILNGTKAA
jgi:hypothetical protein